VVEPMGRTPHISRDVDDEDDEWSEEALALREALRESRASRVRDRHADDPGRSDQAAEKGVSNSWRDCETGRPNHGKGDPRNENWRTRSQGAWQGERHPEQEQMRVKDPHIFSFRGGQAARQADVTGFEAGEPGKVLVVGGWDGVKVLRSVEMLDASSGQWGALPNMSEPRRGAAVTTAQGSVFVFGGWNGQKFLSSCEVFDVRNAALRFGLAPRRWAPLPPLRHTTCHSAAVTTGAHILVIGGSVPPRPFCLQLPIG